MAGQAAGEIDRPVNPEILTEWVPGQLRSLHQVCKRIVSEDSYEVTDAVVIQVAKKLNAFRLPVLDRSLNF